MLSAARSALTALFSTAVPAAPAPIVPRHVAATRVGRGAKDPRHRKDVSRIVVTVEDELFERVRARAVGKKIPLAAEIRHLIKLGLDVGDKP